MPNVHTLQSLLVKKTLLYIGASSLVVVIIWIMIGTFFSYKKSTIPADLQKKTQSITPTIDVDTIQSLKARRSFTDQELSEFEITKILTEEERKASVPSTPPPETTSPSPTPTEEPIPTPTPEPTP